MPERAGLPLGVLLIGGSSVSILGPGAHRAVAVFGCWRDITNGERRSLLDLDVGCLDEVADALEALVEVLAQHVPSSTPAETSAPAGARRELCLSQSPPRQ